jgi:hypothetical protein
MARKSYIDLLQEVEEEMAAKNQLKTPQQTKRNSYDTFRAISNQAGVLTPIRKKKKKEEEKITFGAKEKSPLLEVPTVEEAITKFKPKEEAWYNNFFDGVKGVGSSLAYGVTEGIGALGTVVKENLPSMLSNKVSTRKALEDYEATHGITPEKKEELLNKYIKEYGDGNIDVATTKLAEQYNEKAEKLKLLGGLGQFQNPEEYAQLEKEVAEIEYARDVLQEKRGRKPFTDDIFETMKGTLDFIGLGEAIEGVGDELATPFDQVEELGENTVGTSAQKFGQEHSFIGGVAQSIGGLIPAMVATALTKNTAVGSAVFTASAKGGYYENYVERGYSRKEAEEASTLMAGVELGTEFLGGWLGGVNVFKSGALKEIAEKSGVQTIKALGVEGIEEATAELANIGIDMDLGEDITLEEAGERIGTAFASGVALGVVMKGAGVAGSKAQALAQKINNNEQVTETELVEALEEVAEQENTTVEALLENEITEMQQNTEQETVKEQENAETEKIEAPQAEISDFSEQEQQVTLPEVETAQNNIVEPNTAIDQEIAPVNVQNVAESEENTQKVAESEEKKQIQVYNAVRLDEKNANLDAETKPHGLFLSNLYETDFNEFESPFARQYEGGERHHYKVEPKKPLVVKPLVLDNAKYKYRSGNMATMEADASLSALKELVGEQEFTKVSEMSKQELVEYLNNKYSQYDFSNYYDKAELLMAYGSVEARNQGYDAIITERSTDPDTADIDNEIVVLKNDILKTEAEQDDIAPVKENSKVDNKGREVPQELQEELKDSKARDEEGHLLTVYHGSPNAEITEFDVTKAGSNTQSDFTGIYFTDSQAVADEFSYEQLPGNSNLTYKKGEKGKVYESYLNITNPLDLNNLTDADIENLSKYIDKKKAVGGTEFAINTMKQMNQYKNAQGIKFYLDLEAIKNSGEYDGIIASMGNSSTYKDANEYIVFDSKQIKTAQQEATVEENTAPIEAPIAEQVQETIAPLQETISELTEQVEKLTDLVENAALNNATQETTQAIEEEPYLQEYLNTPRYDADAIEGFDYAAHRGKVEKKASEEILALIDSTSDDKMLEVLKKAYEENEAFDRKIYFDYQDKTKDGRYEDARVEYQFKESVLDGFIADLKGYYGKIDSVRDTMTYKFLKGIDEYAVDDIAPVATAELAENVADTTLDQQVEGNNEPTGIVEDTTPDVLDDKITKATVESPFENRDIKEVGNRKVKAYMYENPEVKPYFQKAANEMLGDLKNTIKGERVYNPELAYETGTADQNGAFGWVGIKRQSTEDISYLIDNFGYTYAQIEEGLNKIIEDNGLENNAVSKRIEFALNDRLLNGYVDVSGVPIPANQEYVNLIEGKNITEYNSNKFANMSDNEMEKFLEEATADFLAEDAPVSENTVETPVETVVNNRHEEIIGGETKELTREEKAADFLKSTATELHHEINNLKKGVRASERLGYILDFGYSWNEIKRALANIERSPAKRVNPNFEAEGMIRETLVYEFEDMKEQEAYDEAMAHSTAEPTNTIHDDMVDSTINRMINPLTAVEASGYGSNRTEKAKTTFKEKVKKTVNTLQDLMVNRSRAVDQYAKQTGNAEIKYKNDRLNNVMAEINGEINVAQTDLYGNKIGDAMITPFLEADKAGLREDFNYYLTMIANIERSARDKGLGTIDAVTSQEIVKAYEQEHPEFIEWKNKVVTYNRNALYNDVAAGIVSKELADQLVAMYPNYMPYYFDIDNNFALSPDEIKAGKTVKTAVGGGDITKMFTIEEAMAKQTISRKIAQLKNDLLTEIVNSQPAVVEFELGNIEASELGETVFTDASGKKYATAYIDGKAKTVEISDDLYNALNNDLDTKIKELEEKFELITKPLQTATTIFGKMNTTWSLTFPITNPIKDMFDAPLNSKHTARWLGNAASGRAFWKMVKKDATWQQFNSLYGADTLQQEYGGGAKTEKIGKNLKTLNAIGHFNQIVEMYPRYIEFLSSLEAGDSTTEALYNAREVTTNFGRGGTIAKAINRNGVAFYNVSIQGFDKLIRNFSGENGAMGIVKAFAKVTALGMLPAVFNHLIFGDDEEYEELSDYVKDNYYLIKLGDGTFFRIPKGRMLSVFGSAARRTLEMTEGEEDAFEGYLTNAWTQVGFSNPITDNIFAGVIDVANNETWYGSDLIPTRLQDAAPEEQYDESTDKFSKWLGEQINYSPYKINYLLDQYGGSAADMILPMLTPEAKTDKDSFLGNFGSIFTSKFTSNSTFNNKYVSEFYDTKDKIGKIPESKATEEEKLQAKYLNDVGWELSDLYKKKREIQSSLLDNAEKYKAVEKVQREIDDISKAALEQYKDIDKSDDYAVIGDKEYYKKDNAWTKVKDKDLEDVNSLGLTTEEKGIYFNTKTELGKLDKRDEKETYLYKSKLDKTIKTAIYENSVLTSFEKEDSNKAYKTAKAVGVDIDTWLDFEKQTFYANKDKNGESISGSKKNKVISYINSLDLSVPQKAIMIRTQYETFDTYNNQIVSYVSDLNMSYAEKVEILENIGFKVDSNGNVKW